MFLEFFNLREDPFGVTPDPAYLYPSRTHCEALDALTEGILGGRGFLALIAEPGMGKTTLLYQALEGMRDTARAAFLFQTQCNSREFFEYLLSELGVDSTGMGLVAMHTKLNEMLFNEMLAGKRFVLIVDEAQNLDDSVLETIRLLSNFETSNTKLLQIILAGQTQLGEKLQQKPLAQLLQRITVVKHLDALSAEETAGYIRHRLKVAGYPGEALFEPAAAALVAELSHGIPRIINKICYRALSEAFLEGSTTVSSEIVAKASRELGFAVPLRVAPRKIAAPEPQPVASTRPWSVPLAPSLAPSLGGPLAAAPLSSSLPEPLIMAPPGIASLSPTPMVAEAKSDVPVVPRLTYTPAVRRDKRRWPLWAMAFLILLLAAGAAMPSNALRKIIRTMHSNVQPPTDIAQPADADSSKSEAADSKLGQPRARDVAGIPAPNQPLANSAGTDGGQQVSLARSLGLKINRIAIDPGHGGNDTGTAGPQGLLEKDLCLDVALRLGRLIDENIPGAQVIYTRTDDRYVSLEERTQIANDANADLFISIHANSSDIRAVRGAETYYLSLTTSERSKALATRENAAAQSSLHNLQELVKEITSNDKLVESKLLAMDIQSELSESLQLVNQAEKNRGVKRAPFLVLTGAHMPAVLSEISFVSNSTDETLLLESAQRQRLAEGLYRGVATYLGGLRSMPSTEQKVVSENRPASSSGLATPSTELGRNSR
jgi:N-acetylmuramoyl-L-alanine amidase/type II secretory pathway predicted ATPase ExeA